MHLPDDLEKLIFKYAGNHTPFQVIRCDSGVLENHFRVQCEMGRKFLQKWTPSYCNVLKWVSTIDDAFLWYYDVVTNLNPTVKRYVEQSREDQGFVPIFPGDRQYPTSRVRFDPSYINDRYFR